jgi:hypothetical protein
MALFFDAAWFDRRLALMGLGRASVGAALRLDDAAVEELFKDQRELKPVEVATLAALLAVSADEIAERAGVGTSVAEPIPDGPFLLRLEAVEAAMARLEERMARIEELLAKAVEKARGERLDEPS